MRDIFSSSWLLYLLSVCAGLLLWHSISTQLPGVIFASPFAVAEHLVGAMAEGDLPARFLNSVRHMLLGLVLALLVAVPLGMLMGRNETVFHMCNPVMTALFAVPSVAFVPFLILWFGIFYEARVALVFVMCFFDILITVTAGARNIEPRVIQAARSFGANRRIMFFGVLMPASYPFLMTALRIGSIRAINGMITAELFFAAVNLGEYMEDASAVFDSAAMLSVVFLLSLFGLLVQELVKWSEAKLLPWHVRD
ncbi:ABC transporter permease [Thiosulfatihalobacter marinus]|nr:ABC transporter permease subunit [Thiosulfatihalobacter marinus]